jgi:hypothetical protein
MHEIPLHSYEFFGSGARLELQQKMARLAPVLERTPGVLNIWRGLGIEAGSGYSAHPDILRGGSALPLLPRKPTFTWPPPSATARNNPKSRSRFK